MAKLNDIQLLRINYLRGPNIWTYRPVLEVWLDLGELEDYPSNLLPGFNDRLTTALPALGPPRFTAAAERPRRHAPGREAWPGTPGPATATASPGPVR